MSSPKSSTALDLEIGQRIKIQRKMRGISQRDLGRHLGLSFQQIQKYESGANRLSTARLTMLAALLDVSITDLLGPEAATSGGETNRDLTALLSSNETLALARAFAAIQSPELRKSLLSMVQAALKIEKEAKEPASHTR